MISIKDELTGMPSYLSTVTNEWFKKINVDRDNFISSKIIEKGFGYLLKGFDTRRFPKICMIKNDEWTYIYVDNDTNNGVFIVAIKDYVFDTDYSDKNFSTKMNVSFAWQDNQPLPFIE